jgi:peptidoglycan/LPS O-acetylase OafA/YrhL
LTGLAAPTLSEWAPLKCQETGERKNAGLPRHQILELDGLRAIAILWVLLLHFVYGWPPTPPAALSRMPLIFVGAVSHGWLGVDLFFILSGFLITGILVDARGRPKYFRNFYARRALRILPLYLICIAVMALAYRGKAFFGLSLLFMANFAHYFRVGIPHGPGVFWSLAVEEHFYLLWPLLVRFLRRSSLFGLTLALVLGTPILRGYCAYMGMDMVREIYVYSFFRFDGLALGAILAMWVRSDYYNRKMAWRFAGLLAGFALLITLCGLPFGIMQAHTAASCALRSTQAQFLFAAAIIVVLAFRGSTYTAFLRSRPARVTAELSFCLYLIHLALGDGYYRVLHAMHFNDVAHFGIDGAVFVRFLVIGTAAFGLAALSRRFVENPILQLKRYF